MINEVAIKEENFKQAIRQMIPTSNINVGCWMFDLFAEAVTMWSLFLISCELQVKIIARQILIW